MVHLCHRTHLCALHLTAQCTSLYIGYPKLINLPGVLNVADTIKQNIVKELGFSSFRDAGKEIYSLLISRLAG
jgi:hypothetical protein